MSGVLRGPFLPRKASPRPMSPRHRWPVAVTARRSLAPSFRSLLCGVSLRKNATLWPFHLLTPALPKEILKEEIAVAGKKRSKRQKAHPFGGFFCFSTKIPLNQTSPEGAGWDEELSNIDPQAVYHTAWGDFGNRKTGNPRNRQGRFLP